MDVQPEGIRIHFYAGEQEIKRGLIAKEGGPSGFIESDFTGLSTVADSTSGGQDRKVGERLGEPGEAVVIVEIEAYPEAKVLTAGELALLRNELGSDRRVAERIGGTRGFVRDQRASLT